MKQHQSFSQWKEDQSGRNQDLIEALEALIFKIAPNLERNVKWGQGCFLDTNAPIIYIHTKPDLIQLGFYAGSFLEDPERLLKGKGKFVRFIIIKELSDINEIAFTKIIEQAISRGRA